jgi:hypothetical protein
LKIPFTFLTKLATLTRRSTVQNFLPQLVFPGLINNLVNFSLVQLRQRKMYKFRHTHTNKQNRKRERHKHTHNQTNRKKHTQTNKQKDTHTQTRQIDTHTCKKTHARKGAHAHTGMDTNKNTQKTIPFKNFISLRRLFIVAYLLGSYNNDTLLLTINI